MIISSHATRMNEQHVTLQTAAPTISSTVTETGEQL
jgi:hypothetical protein